MITTTCLVLAASLFGSSSSPVVPLGAMTVEWRAETHVDTIRVRRLGFPQSPTTIRAWAGEPLEFEELEPGTYLVEAQSPWCNASMRIRVRAGEAREAVFEPSLEERLEGPLVVRSATCAWCCADDQRTGVRRPSMISRVGQ